MNDQMQDGMAEATRLTREGRLNEAVAAIQRALGGASSPIASPRSSGNAGEQDEPIETTFSIVDEAPPTSTTRPAPEPPPRFRDMPRLPSDLSSLLPGGSLSGLLEGLSGGLPGMTAGVSAPTVVPEGGRLVERSYADAAGGRNYKLYIPSGYIGQATPLVVMLHGCTQSPDDFATGTHMNALAEEHTFLVAYPAQSQNANMSRCWNWFKAADQQRGQGEPSLIAGITRQVMDEYHVADGRVYVAGMSAGGAMAAIMGETYPDLYAAVGVHSGLAPGAAHDFSSAFSAMQNGGQGIPHRRPIVATARVVPTIVFHGDRDTTVHPRNADQLLAHLAAANTAANRDATGQSLPPAKLRQGQVPGGHAYACATYHDADGRAVVERWTVHGMGHCWSGGSQPGSYTDPKGPDASAEMVRFFLQHPGPEPTGLPVD